MSKYHVLVTPGISLLVMLVMAYRWSTRSGITYLTISHTDGWQTKIACKNSDLQIHECSHDDLVLTNIPPSK